MGKFAVLAIILASIFLIACGSTEAGRPAATSSPQITNESRSRNSFFGELSAGKESGATLRESPMGPAGAQGPAGPAGPPGAPGPEGLFDRDRRESPGIAPASQPTATPAPAMAAQPSAAEGEDSGGPLSPLQIAQRRVISTASISIQVERVQETVNRVRTIAESLGGFVEQLSSSGGSNQEQAHLTIRVPQDQFFTAMERLEGLGEVQNRNLGSEDVSSQFIDLEARLRSAQREEQSLLSLLERATQVSEILTIERELNRVRTEIERLQGQLNFLERRVELATISISLYPPPEERPEPPSALLVVEQSNISSQVTEVKNLVSSLEGEVDRVFLSSQDGRERADISFRVFPADFNQAVGFLEASGTVRSKELREGTIMPAEGVEPPEEPNAVVQVSFFEPEPSNTGLIISIAAPVGGVVLVIILAAAFYYTYQAGRRRRDRFVQA